MLNGKHIKLRALEPSDIDLLFEWENNSEVWQISDTIQPYSRFSLEQYVNSVQDIYAQKQIRFIIEELGTQKALGCVDLFDFEPNHRRVGVGILISEVDQRKRGFGKESIELILEYCRDILECHQVYCNVLTTNQISLNLFEYFGFHAIGVKKDWIRIGKEIHDEVLLQKIFK
jgi:diamine N-acetyltransferase